MARYAFGDFCLDDATHALSRDGTPVALTPRVFDTLLHLLARSGELIDKDELMQAVWPSRVVEENNLNQAISALRRALGETRGEHRYILTVPGRGYRFVAPVRVASSTDPALAAKPLRTLAVLPFRLLQPVADEVLQTGVADTLITRFSGLGELVVRPLSAVYRFSGAQRDPLEIGRRLGVDAVLDGTIQQAASRVRISLRLLNVAEGRQQWAEIFDTQAHDPFALQDAVAEKAAAALALRLTYDERIRLTRRYTDDPDAWRCYARARFLVEQRSPSGLKQAIACFRQALTLDPGYALPHAELSDVYTLQGVMGARPPHEVGPLALEAALHALAIDERLPVAHYALGHALVQYERDRRGAELAYRRALELDPNCANARHRYAILLMTSARPDEAFTQIRRARELDPTSLPMDVTEGFLYYWDRQYARAIGHLRDSIEREPHYWMAHYWLAQVLGSCGEHAAAATSAQRANELLGDGGAAWLVAWAHAVAGRRDEALAELDALLQRSRHRYVPPCDIAQVHAGLGDAGQVFAWLDRAEREHARYLDALGVNPILDAFRADPRMADLCARVGITPPASPR
ncbi:winged helix-turn-helix domain-containing protein [Rhodanobacter thiooxydans]|uniref:winged helix-turn-helix domain-containing protein n=1 Tax=Rhodanobacter thiooxydans TaxID=416169 RepID=UPI000260FBF2|nr:winged helix-turn-helix domain-containing protein [Rhodanobacter thiooxydans]EIL98837.1 transcriptional regulator domain-containing protein [Rhodanobacter thiooxydans LCS2]MCW0201164.1 winged helix-turn-helix domain-containing protein [Rhodanobacter thiooxydans]